MRDQRWFVYNLSPSFNWGAHGFTGNVQCLASLQRALNFIITDADLKNFVWELGKEGHVVLLFVICPLLILRFA